MTPNSSTNRNTGMDDHPAADGALIDTSSVIAVARAYLGNFLAETSEQFDGDNYAVRRNYWRVLRAIRHLSNFEISSAATLVLAASAQDAPELSAVEDIGSADICEGAEEVQNTTNPLITILPVPCIVVTAMTAETLEVAADSSSILSDTKTQQNASKPSQMACDNKTIVDSTSVIGKSSTVIVTTNTSTNEISATSSLVGFPVALSASVVAENYRIKCRADALSKYMSSMGTIDRDTQFQTWLIIIKDYWAALRVARRGPESKHPLVTDPLVSVSKINAKVDVPVVIPMTYTSVNQIAAYMGDQNLNNQPHAVDLTSDRMHMSGFAGIARNLSHMHPAEVNMTLWGVDSFDQWSSLVVSTNPSYSYEDNPLPGWSKNICVRMGGKNQGSLEITYSPPERTRRMRSKMEIQSYFTKYNLPNSLVSRFDFRSVFCVCHTPEDGGSYLECSFGRAGCNRWLHPQCVGLGKKKEGELRDMVTVVCPFCTVYLESIGAKEYLKNKLCLRKVSLAVPLTSVVVNGFEIFESSRPHTQWGIPHIGKKLSGNANLQMTSLPSSGLCQYSSSKSEKQSQNHYGPGSLLTAISQQGCRSPSVGVGGDKNMVRTVDSGDISTSGDSGIQIIKAVGTLSTTHNSSDNSSSVAALMPSSITPMASPCEEPTALPGLCPLELQSASGVSPSPRKSPKPNEQPYPAAEIDLVVNTNPHGKSIGNVKEVQIVTSSPLGIKSRTSAAARLMSTDPTLCSMFAHRLFMGATIPNNSVESEVDQEIHSPPSSTLLFNSLEKKREVGKAVLADTGTVIEDPMYTVIEYSKNIEPRDRIRWARVLNRTISPTSPSSSSSSSSCTISSSSATQLSFLASSADVAVPPNLVYHPSYLRIKVTGGWMKTKGKGRQVDGSVPAGSAGSYDTDMPNDTDVEIGMTVEQRVRQKAASVCNQRQIPLHPQNEESFSLCGRYKRKLLEAVAASAYSAAHKRKTSSGDVKTTVGYYNHPLSNPLLFYLPSDGGLTAACVSCAPVPISLQTLCASGEMCAYCLHRFQPNMRLYSPAQMSHMAKKRREKERRAAAIRKKVPSREGGEGDHAEEDSSESVLHLVSKKVGSVLYTIHRQCAFAIDSGWLFTSHSSSHARLSARYSVDQGPISSSSAAGSGSGSSCDVEEGVVVNNSVTASKGIDLGDLYECDEGDDAECDLCGRAGGIMQFFDLHAQYSSQLPPGEEGWLGHIPCVSWLIKSRLLELPPSSICYSRSRPYMHATGDASSVIVPDNEIDVIDSGTKSLSSFSTSGNGSIEAASLDLSAQHESPSVNNNTPVPAIGEKWMSYVSIPTIPSSTTTRTSPTLKRDFNDFCSPHAHASRERTHTAIEDMATSLRDDLPSKTLTAVDGTATATPSTEFVALTIPPSTAVSSINSIMCDKQDNQHGSNRDLLGDPGSTWNVEDAQTRMDINPDVQKEVEKEIDAVLEPSLEDGKEDVDVPVGEQESLNDLSKIQPSDSALDQSKKERQPLSSSMTQQPSPSPSPHHKHVPEKARRKGEILRPLSLFDSLVGQWRCSLCGTYAGVVLRCTAVACTVRAHPLCVSVAGKGWSDFSVARYCSTSPESATINGDQCNRTRGGQKIGETDCVLGFLCALHSVESKQ